MQARAVALAMIGLALYVAASSWLGLTHLWFFAEPADATGFFFIIWGQSLAGNLVFIVGSALAGTLAFTVARDRAWWAGILTGAAANWMVYAASFQFLEEANEHPDFFGTLSFVGAWGWMGLIFCALAPTLAAISWAKWGRRDARHHAS